jgi:hypothetical protein
MRTEIAGAMGKECLERRVLGEGIIAMFVTTLARTEMPNAAGSEPGSPHYGEDWQRLESLLHLCDTVEESHTDGQQAGDIDLIDFNIPPMIDELRSN